MLSVIATTDSLGGVNAPLAFAAGLASFLSPCVLPLVPAYLAYLGARAARPVGVGAAAGGGDVAAEAGSSRSSVFTSGVAFVAGLSLVFVLFFYVLLTALAPVKAFVPTVGGILVIIMAFQVAGVIRIPFLMREYRVNNEAPTRGGLGGGFLLGVSFASGWTPCIGATLGAVLSSALSVGTTGKGLVLIVAYCLGLGLPFLAIAAGVDRAQPLVRALNRRRRVIDLASAAILVVMGLLLLTNQMTVISVNLSKVVPDFFSRFSL